MKKNELGGEEKFFTFRSFRNNFFLLKICKMFSFVVDEKIKRIDVWIGCFERAK